MKIKSIIYLSFATLFFASCATTYHVTSSYEKDVAFQSYRTFNYHSHEHNFPKGANPINMQRIEQAIGSKLENLGYKKTDDPDLLVSWFITVKLVNKIDYYRNYYNGWYYTPYVYAEVYDYQEGTLVIDIIDKTNNQVIWHGKTQDQLSEGMPKIEKKIKAAVKAMFKQYAKDAKWKKEDYVFDG